MIDNFEIIKPLLSFDSDDEFYFVQILQRKKDNPTGYMGSNNSSRLVKAYYIDSIDRLDRYRGEMIKLAELFNARVGINLNKRSYYKTAFNTLKHMAEQMHNKQFKYLQRAWNTSCGVHNGGDKIWLLNFDRLLDPLEYNHVCNVIYQANPIGEKIIDAVPSKSGFHLITKGFDPREFKEDFPEIEIHKNNPTNLYIP